MEVEVMRTGTWQDSAGRSHTYTADDLDRIAQQYSVRENDAPVVIGHPKTDDPAYGATGDTPFF